MTKKKIIFVIRNNKENEREKVPIEQRRTAQKQQSKANKKKILRHRIPTSYLNCIYLLMINHTIRVNLKHVINLPLCISTSTCVPGSVSIAVFRYAPNLCILYGNWQVR